MIIDGKPWHKSYDSCVEPEVDIPNVSLKDYFLDTFRRHEDHVAFHYLGTETLFLDLMEQSGRFATLLQQSGLKKGDVVAISLPNTPQYFIAMIGTLRAGGVVSGLAPLLMPDEMVYQLNNCEAKVLVSMDLVFEAKIGAIVDQCPALHTIFVTGVFDSLPGVTETSVGVPLAGKTVQTFYSALNSVSEQPMAVDIDPDEVCFIQYTGGTTGPPKGALLTHRNIVANMCQFAAWMTINSHKEIWLSGFPMFHQAGLFMSCCAAAWAVTQVLIPDPRNTGHIIEELINHHPTVLINVPSLYMMLLVEPRFPQLDFSGLKFCVSGAAPFPVDAAQMLERTVGVGKIVEVWGMTETSPLITANPIINHKKLGSVGLPLPNTKLRIVSLHDGETKMSAGFEGELICSGPQVMKGYLKNPAETAKTLREHDGEIWMHTGDIGRMDSDGYIYVVDRAKDMLIVGGYKVFSSEVEGKLQMHPDIDLCAIVGMDNPDRPDSQIVKLVVQKSEACASRSEDEIRLGILSYAKEQLAPYKVPKICEFVDAIPLTSVGKIDKKALRG